MQTTDNELRRIHLPGTSVNRAKRGPRLLNPDPLLSLEAAGFVRRSRFGRLSPGRFAGVVFGVGNPRFTPTTCFDGVDLLVVDAGFAFARVGDPLAVRREGSIFLFAPRDLGLTAPRTTRATGTV